jgi:hypothetical protein
MRYVFIGLAVALGLSLIAAILFARHNLRDRHPGYTVDLRIPPGEPGIIRVGFSALPITPEVPDRWTDANGDARYVPGDGDAYSDDNGNGCFDPVWIAGFQNRRPAAGVNDPLWARCMVIDDGHTRLALVSLDAIGFMHDDVVSVRKKIEPTLGVTYTMVHATHSHQTPDLLGLWGESYLKSGVDKAYLHYVIDQAAASVRQAVANLRPARLRFAQNLADAGSTVADTRLPEVHDSGLRLIQALDAETRNTLGVLISWANHPETVWNRNLMISSDFPHYLRESVEKGIYMNDSLHIPGTGGVALFVNGSIGGLMTTHPGVKVPDPVSGQIFTEPSFAKAEAQGRLIAALALGALRQPADSLEKGSIALLARTLELPLQNPVFKLGALLGVLNRGTVGWMTMQTEMAVLSLGPATFLTVPGEIYPEIVNGGVEAPVGRDFAVAPVEVPPIRQSMKGDFKFILGLCSDMIGYIIPKSQWDEKAPYTYQAAEAPYGEINSIGPDAAPLIHAAATDMLRQLYSPENDE